MSEGYLMLVLHAHLPFVRHPELKYNLEENWLFEAITETYLPLLMAFDRLHNDNVDFRVTLTLTPTLMNMLEDEYLQKKYQEYLQSRLDLAEKEKIRTWSMPEFHNLARWYQAHFQEIEFSFYREYGGSLRNAFSKFAGLGKLEVMTCAATHGFLPFLQMHPQAVRSQIKTGVETYRNFMGQDPQGIWLPECAYYPGIEEVLSESGLRYFFLDTAGITGANPSSPYGIYAPIKSDYGLAVFGRESETSRQVWCAQTGYPGDPVYRDFYRDLGFDLDMEYISPYVDPAGIRLFTGFKYYRITGDTDQKQAYSPLHAQEQARNHAEHFAHSLFEQSQNQKHHMDRPPLIVSAYDAELLGHWWFEGPTWLEHLFRAIEREKKVKPVTGSEYLTQYPENPSAQPAISSWGNQGYFNTWLNARNDWIYPQLYAAGELMHELVEQYPQAEGLTERALNQALRELLLAQSSDWAFIINNQTASEYAERRTKEHLWNLHQIYQCLSSFENSAGVPSELEALVSRLEFGNNVFPKIDYRVFRSL